MSHCGEVRVKPLDLENAGRPRRTIGKKLRLGGAMRSEHVVPPKTKQLPKPSKPLPQLKEQQLSNQFSLR